MAGILTIGHSTHPIQHFLALVKQHGVTAVADVRSVPASRFTPHFNRAALHRALQDDRVRYAFLGKELGARPDDPSCYVDGRVKWDRLIQTEAFSAGITRLRNGMEKERIALMCAEHEPLSCHRTILVSRVLTDLGVSVSHIHRDGHLESQSAAMMRLMASFGLDQVDLFRTQDQLLVEALRRQENLIAYDRKDRENQVKPR